MKLKTGKILIPVCEKSGNFGQLSESPELDIIVFQSRREPEAVEMGQEIQLEYRYRFRTEIVKIRDIDKDD